MLALPINSKNGLWNTHLCDLVDSTRVLLDTGMEGGDPPREAGERHELTAWVPILPQTLWGGAGQGGGLDESQGLLSLSLMIPLYRLNQFNDEVSELSPA